MTPMPSFDILVEASSLALSLVLIVIVARLTRRISRLSEPDLSTLLFLRAAAIRRSLVVLAVAIAVFVAIPMSDIAGRLTDARTFEIIHDLAHLVFLIIVLGGMMMLLRMTPLPRQQTAPEESVKIQSSESLVKVNRSR